MAIETDVLVCGGGCAGLGAALAAARNGVKVVLVERAGFAGGIITAAGLPFFDGIAHKTTGRVVVRGIALELLSRMGVCPPDATTIRPHNPMIPHVDRFKLTADDIRQGRRFDDSIATGCWYLDIHPNAATPGAAQLVEGFQPEPYDIPYRSVLANRVSNLLVAGRCHSATREAASSTRVTVTAMALGQAAGTAAALLVERGMSPHELNGREVREKLHQQHAGPILPN